MDVPIDPNLGWRDKVIIAVLNLVGWVTVLIALGDVGIRSLITGPALSFGEWRSCGIAVLVGAVFVGLGSVWPIRLSKKTAELAPLTYLRNEDSDLGSAIREMAFRSAWGRWYAAQRLVLDDSKEQRLDNLMRVAANHVTDALMNGELEARGRKPGEMDFVPIPATYWRSSSLHMIKDNITLWKMILIPHGGAEFTPDGDVIGRDEVSVSRTAILASYDSLIVKARQFEKLWPQKDAPTDKARRAYLREAKQIGRDRDEIRALEMNS